MTSQGGPDVPLHCWGGYLAPATILSGQTSPRDHIRQEERLQWEARKDHGLSTCCMLRSALCSRNHYN